MRLSLLASALVVLTGCGSSDSGESGSGGGGGAGGASLHALHVTVAFSDDGQGVNLFAQNGAVVHVPPADIVGKQLVWATTPGGEPINNTLPIEFGSVTMGADLSASFATESTYADGPWEMAAFVSIAGDDPTNGPQPGDLAAFDNRPPPAGQPPVTGTSVRMTVDGNDAELTMGNDFFIQF